MRGEIMSDTVRIFKYPTMLTAPVVQPRRSRTLMRGITNLWDYRISKSLDQKANFNGAWQVKARITSLTDAIARTEDNLAMLKRHLQDERFQLAALTTQGKIVKQFRPS